MAEDTVEIEYQLTLDDYAACAAVISCDYIKDVPLAKRLIANVKAMMIGVVFVLILVMCFESLSSDASAESMINLVVNFFSPEFAFMLGLFLFITIIFTYLPMKAFQYKKMKLCCLDMYKRGENLMILAPASLRFDAEGIAHKNDYTNSIVKWSGIEKIEVRDGNLFVFLSAVSAYYIPERFFASREEVEGVADKCRSWFELGKVGNDQ